MGIGIVGCWNQMQHERSLPYSQGQALRLLCVLCGRCKWAAIYGEQIMRQIDNDHVNLTRVGVVLRPLDRPSGTLTLIVYPQPLHRATLDFTSIHTETMRRAQSVRHYTRASVPTTGVNDMGALKEVPEESTEVSLRRQLLDKSKENDKVCGPSNLVALLLIFYLASFFSQCSSETKFRHSRRSSRSGHPSRLFRSCERNTVTLNLFYKARSARMNGP